MIKDPSLLYPAVREYNSYPGGHTEGFADASKHTIRKIYEAIRAGKTDMDYPKFTDGYRELALCEAIVRSAEKETWMKVEE